MTKEVTTEIEKESLTKESVEVVNPPSSEENTPKESLDKPVSSPVVAENEDDLDDSLDDLDDESDDDKSKDSSPSEALTSPSIKEDEFMSLRKDVRDLGKKKEWLFETRSIVSQQIKELFDILKEKKDKRDLLTKKVKELKDSREKINSEIKDSISKIKKTDTPFQKTERVPVSKIKKELENLQYKVETTPLSPEEEKKVMRLIKEKEKQIKKAQVDVSEKGEYKELSQEINDSKKVSNDVHVKIQECAKESQDNHEEMISVSKDIKYLKAREKEIHHQFTEIKDVYKEKRKLYNQNKKFFEKAIKSKRKDFKVTEAQVLEKVEANVEEKMKKGMKITTEDLMSFGR